MDDVRDTQTPTTDTNALMMALVILNGDIGAMTASMIAGMYPNPAAMTN